MPHYAADQRHPPAGAGRSRVPLGAVALASFMQSARRGSLRIHELVRANGDATPFAFEKGVLLRGIEWVPAVLVGSEIALHVVEYRTQHSAVCSYNRVLRFDEVEHGSTTTLGLCLYMGATPIAEKVASGREFRRSELALHVVEAPVTPALRRVAGAIRQGYAESGVPAEAHRIAQFVF